MRLSNAVLYAAGILFGVCVGYSVRGVRTERPSPEIKQPVPIVQELEEIVEETYTIAKVVDGDTIDVEQGIEVLLYRIRLLGIDTPEEGEPGFNEAKEFLKKETYGKSVILEKDPSQDLGRYGRPLRYIVVDGRNINVEMVRLGYARARWHKGLRYEKEILEAEQEAEEQKRGVWAGR